MPNTIAVVGTLHRVNDQTDQQLLRDYAERQSEAAFATIVHRYVDLVHSAAFRMVCDAHAARDVTQSVFVVLAQNARQLTDRPALAGWLHGTARNLAAKAVRSEVRRRAREQEAAVMNELLPANPDINWEHIAPHLDDALGELSEPDRDAVLLRYFKNQDLRTVGATLGISDDTAQKRVSRAVERLREFFTKRGVTVGASGLGVVISANAVQAAPVGLALTISTAAALTGTTLATATTTTAIKAIAMTTLQKTIVTATIAVLAGAGIYEARQAAQPKLARRIRPDRIGRRFSRTLDPLRGFGLFHRAPLGRRRPTSGGRCAEEFNLVKAWPCLEKRFSEPDGFSYFQSEYLATMLDLKDDNAKWGWRRILEQARTEEHARGLKGARMSGEEIQRFLPNQKIEKIRQEWNELNQKTTEGIASLLSDSQRQIFMSNFSNVMDFDPRLKSSPETVANNPRFQDLNPREVMEAFLPPGKRINRPVNRIGLN